MAQNVSSGLFNCGPDANDSAPDYDPDYMAVFDSKLIPCFAPFGFIGNGLVIFFFYRKHKKHQAPAALVLMIISLMIVDTISLIMIILVRTIPIYHPDIRMQNINGVRGFSPIFIVLIHLLIFASATSRLLEVLVVADRFFAVTKPFLHMEMVTVRRALVSIAAVMIAALVTNAHIYSTGFSSDRRTRDILQIYNVVVQTFVYFLIPCILILYMNVRICSDILKSQKMHHTEYDQNNRALTDELLITVMLCLDAFVYLIANTFYFFDEVAKFAELACADFGGYMILKVVLVHSADTLFLFNLCSNFMTFYACGSSFREFVAEKCCKPKQILRRHSRFSDQNQQTKTHVERLTLEEVGSAHTKLLPHSELSGQIEPAH